MIPYIHPTAIVPQNAALSVKRAHRRYYYDTYAYTHKTTVWETGTDVHGTYLIPKETIFHPQGGGQPADEGYFIIKGLKIPVKMLQEDVSEGYIKHYYVLSDDLPPIAVGEPIAMQIDGEKRLLFAVYHTAGHLVADLLAKRYPTLQGIKGNHFPGQGAVVFVEKTKIGAPVVKEDYATYDLAKMKEDLNTQLAIYQQRAEEITIDNSGLKRMIQIGSSPLVACGGTHLTHTSGLQDFQITKVAFKKREGIKISYAVAPTL